MVIWAPPTSPHLTDELLMEADRLWQEAERLAASDAAVLKRVQLGRMSVDYAIVERVRAAAGKKDSPPSPLAALAVERFKPFVGNAGRQRPDPPARMAATRYRRLPRQAGGGPGRTAVGSNVRKTDEKKPGFSEKAGLLGDAFRNATCNKSSGRIRSGSCSVVGGKFNQSCRRPCGRSSTSCRRGR